MKNTANPNYTYMGPYAEPAKIFRASRLSMLFFKVELPEMVNTLEYIKKKVWARIQG
jgi:hypothetical protein